jgi:hypothetical protein
LTATVPEKVLYQLTATVPATALAEAVAVGTVVMVLYLSKAVEPRTR